MKAALDCINEVEQVHDKKTHFPYGEFRYGQKEEPYELCMDADDFADVKYGKSEQYTGDMSSEYSDGESRKEGGRDVELKATEDKIWGLRDLNGMQKRQIEEKKRQLETLNENIFIMHKQLFSIKQQISCVMAETQTNDSILVGELMDQLQLSKQDINLQYLEKVKKSEISEYRREKQAFEDLNEKRKSLRAEEATNPEEYFQLNSNVDAIKEIKKKFSQLKEQEKEQITQYNGIKSQNDKLLKNIQTKQQLIQKELKKAQFSQQNEFPQKNAKFVSKKSNQLPPAQEDQKQSFKMLGMLLFWAFMLTYFTIDIVLVP